MRQVVILLLCVVLTVTGCGRRGGVHGIHDRSLSFEEGQPGIPGIDAASVNHVTMTAGPEEGVSFLVWSDLPNGGGGGGSGSSAGAYYSGRHQGRHGRQVEFRAETTDGVSGTITIEGTTFNLADGPLLLVGTQHDQTTIRQFDYDLSRLPAKVDDYKQHAKADETIAGFFLKQMVLGKWLSSDGAMELEFLEEGNYHCRLLRLDEAGEEGTTRNRQVEQGSFRLDPQGPTLLITGDLFGQSGLSDAAFHVDKYNEQSLHITRAGDRQVFELRFVPPAGPPGPGVP